jgi:hypothetical protein
VLLLPVQGNYRLRGVGTFNIALGSGPTQTPPRPWSTPNARRSWWKKLRMKA